MDYISNIDLYNEELIIKLDSRLNSVSKSRSVLKPQFELKDLDCVCFGKQNLWFFSEVLLPLLETLFT